MWWKEEIHPPSLVTIHFDDKNELDVIRKTHKLRPAISHQESLVKVWADFLHGPLGAIRYNWKVLSLDLQSTGIRIYCLYNLMRTRHLMWNACPLSLELQWRTDGVWGVETLIRDRGMQLHSQTNSFVSSDIFHGRKIPKGNET